MSGLLICIISTVKALKSWQHFGPTGKLVKLGRGQLTVVVNSGVGQLEGVLYHMKYKMNTLPPCQEYQRTVCWWCALRASSLLPGRRSWNQWYQRRRPLAREGWCPVTVAWLNWKQDGHRNDCVSVKFPHVDAHPHFKTTPFCILKSMEPVVVKQDATWKGGLMDSVCGMLDLKLRSQYKNYFSDRSSRRQLSDILPFPPLFGRIG